jgi:serine protease Do
MKRYFYSLLTLIFTLLLSGGLIMSGLAASALAQERGLESLRQSGQVFRGVAKKVSPAVVFIQVERADSNDDSAEFMTPFNDEFMRRFFGRMPRFNSPRQGPSRHRAVGQGSGFIISPDGYILTNNHVVEGSDKVDVRLLDGREYSARIVGTDSPSDLAVIKIDESDLPFLRLGDSNRLEVGDWVLAVGNPFGLSHTLTAGIVSAKGRSGIGLSDYENFIQTDAAINPGNSGGPLVNLDGEVVGINTAIFSRSGGYMGIGFAIPINMAKQVRDQLIAYGEVTRGRLGVYIQELTKELAESFGLDQAKGILIAQVIEDSPAAEAGLKRGDIITRIDGDKVGTLAEFRNRIAMTEPGRVIRLRILRAGDEELIKATIGELSGDQVGASTESGSASSLGLSLETLTSDLAARLGYQGEQGVLVAAVEPDSVAARAGIRRGDLIQEIDRQAVTTAAQARELLAQDKTHLLLIRDAEATRYQTLKSED